MYQRSIYISYVLFYKQPNYKIKNYTLCTCFANFAALFPLLKVGIATKFHSENFSASKVGQNRLGRNLRRNTEPAAGEGLRLTYGYGKAGPQRMVTVTCSSVVHRCTYTLHYTVHRVSSGNMNCSGIIIRVIRVALRPGPFKGAEWRAEGVQKDSLLLCLHTLRRFALD